MKVKDLIANLQTLDQDKEILLVNFCSIVNEPIISFSEDCGYKDNFYIFDYGTELRKKCKYEGDETY